MEGLGGQIDATVRGSDRPMKGSRCQLEGLRGLMRIWGDSQRFCKDKNRGMRTVALGVKGPSGVGKRQ